ncbi:MAG: phenylalanine--tRNA ligase subunit alpha [Sulfobacillus sp.]
MPAQPLQFYLDAIEQADLPGVEALRVAWLGRHGTLTDALRQLASLDPEHRRQVGQELNRLKQAVEQNLAQRQQQLAADALRLRLASEEVDLSLPGEPVAVGHPHPLALIQDRLVSIFVAMGFAVAVGPEVEDDWHNFEALNFPHDHPARDMQDSFSLAAGGWLLRTHTSPVQIRAMQLSAPRPLRIIAPGRVYRRDDDATHASSFHQIEALVIDQAVSMAHLKATVATFARTLFGPDVPLRFRPSYFPFTEPSAELDVGCLFCQQAGCALCKMSGWLEVLGSGMVHPKVLTAGGYDPERVSGFAFGVGIERLAMLYYQIPDVRLLLEGDLRFLSQF